MGLFDNNRRVSPLGVAAAVAALVAVVGGLAWNAFFRPTASAGPPKQVHPGMYDLRAEVQRANAARQSGSGAPPQAPGPAAGR
jgi:hypothetical protein